MKKMKLNQLNSFSLSEMEMGQVKGGQTVKGNCACACRYAQKGGSSTSGNGNANNSGGLSSPGMKLIHSVDRPVENGGFSTNESWVPPCEKQ